MPNVGAPNRSVVVRSTRTSRLRDALRRIVTRARLTDDDVIELTHLWKQPHGLTESTLLAVPLEASHLPPHNSGGAVAITEVTHIANVNALTPNETVIYGDNGAGKSGYSRILRRVCRARGGGEAILANALSEKPAGTPTARVTYEVNGVAAEHLWKDGAAGPASLAAISVFDSAAAHMYVSDRTDVRFRPLSLDVFDRLATACAMVKGGLKEEQTVWWDRLSPGPSLVRCGDQGLAWIQYHDQSPQEEPDVDSCR